MTKSTAKTPISDESRSMRPTAFSSRSPLLFAALVAFVLSFTACGSGRNLTKANVDEVADGMAKKQVESILGPPTSVDNKDLLLLKKTIYVYNQGKDSITIMFKDDKVQSKESTLTK